MDQRLVLVHLLVVLIGARLAAELAERMRQPAVLVEIVAGILIGPSVFGLVGHDEVLKVLGELGAILLLFEVGMHTGIKELGRVGGDSLRVAAIGVLMPLAFGFAALRALGVEEPVAIFIAGAITATSVGITARVFGDLRALATAEARTVLAAAVADDVTGLLVLTIVVGIVSSGGITLGAVAGILVTALAFIFVATVMGVWLAPRLVRNIAKGSRTEGTLMAMGLGLALVFALAASAAGLAPIVGAFIAGLAVSASDARNELHRRLVPLGHFLIPVFFLSIGIETDVKVLADPGVLGIAAAISVIAVAGKIVAGFGVRRGNADRLLVGIAMIPRGEVGLIFAGIGLTSGILDARLYAVLVLVVLATTLVTPAWVRHRILATRRRAIAGTSRAVEPPGGWIRVTQDEVELSAEPPDVLAPRIGLDVALACATRRPGARLLQWLSGVDFETATWDASLRERLFKLLQEGNERSWRFLEATGLLSSLLPALEGTLDSRKRDPFQLDPAMALRWNTLDDLKDLVREGADRAVDVWNGLGKQNLVLLAALARSAFDAAPGEAAAALAFAQSLGLAAKDVEMITALVAERHLLPAAAARLDLGAEDPILELAAYLATAELAGALYVIAVAEDAMEPWERERLDELFDLVREALAHPDLTGAAASDLVDQRRLAAVKALSDHAEDVVRSHLEAAPRRYLLAQTPDAIARHLRMTATKLGRLDVRLEAEPAGGSNEWIVHVALQDRKALLASIAGALWANKISVQEAFVSTWRTGVAIDVFRVHAPSDVQWETVRRSVAEAIVNDQANGGLRSAIEGTVDIDNLASPWHSIVEVRAHDRAGLLYRVASALSRAGVQIHMATLSTRKGIAVDIFYVTGRTGGKLDKAGEAALRTSFEGKATRRWRAPWRRETKS